MSGSAWDGAAEPANRLVAGRYRLLGQLGRGGMGVVWQARDELLDREVAVKEVRAPAGLPAPEVRQLYERLEREGRAAARIAHRNVVTVHDVVTEDGRPWIVMELVRGLSLADVLEAEGALAPARAAQIGADVLAALRGAHAVGVLHRDVKPGNVLIADDGRVVLSDFGIAVVEGSSALTRTGELIGSPEFLAPERALGEPPGPQSDVWSLGVTLYAAVEGFSPFRSDTPLSTLRAVVDRELPPPRRAGPLTPVLEGLLRKDPTLRLRAEEAERMLRTVAGGMPLSPSAAPTAPTVPAYSPTGPGRALGAEAGPAGPPTVTGPVPAPGSAAGTPPEPRDDRRRRVAVVFTAAAVVLALAVAGLVWALTRGGGGGGSASSGSSPAGGGAAASPGTPAGGRAGQSSASGAPSVQVSVSAVRDRYSGPCPPPADQAPAFTATFTVGSVPATVTYRWVTGSGSVTDGGEKTVEFTGARSQTVRHAESERGASDAGRDWIAVEVTGPGRLTSAHVPFTVQCRQQSSSGPGRSAPPSSASAPATTPAPAGSSPNSSGSSGSSYGSGSYGGARGY
ncbi:protein kinase [Streptomyces gamaensis]|uniref:non-specific serine/threonine protein kinase n=1 Tax=Streptomyces gamaensis TaxID=1763542 RepID=A0ABW0YPW4_9ACTN